MEEVVALMEDARKCMSQFETSEQLFDRLVLNQLIGNVSNSLSLIGRCILKHPNSTVEIPVPFDEIERNKTDLAASLLEANVFSDLSSILSAIFNIILGNTSFSIPFGDSQQYWSLLLVSLQGIRINTEDLFEKLASNGSHPQLQASVVAFRDNFITMLGDFEEQSTAAWQHWMELTFSLGIHRQDWHSHSPFMRNKRLSPVIAHSLSITRQTISVIQNQVLEIPFLLSVQHRMLMEVWVQAKSLELLHSTVLMIISTYSRLAVSRTRLWQWQVDLIFVIYAALHTLDQIQAKMSAIPTARSASDTSYRPDKASALAKHRLICFLAFTDALLCLSTTTDLAILESHVQKDLLGAFAPASDKISLKHCDDTALLTLSQMDLALQSLRDRYAQASITAECIHVASQGHNEQCFSFALDILALMGFHSDRSDSLFQFTLNNTSERDMFQKELSSALQDISLGLNGNGSLQESTSLSISVNSQPALSVVVTYPAIAVWACREVLFARLVSCLQSLTASLNPALTSTVKYSPILFSILPTTRTIPLLLLHTQYRLLLYGGVLSECLESNEKDPNFTEVMFKRVMHSWIHCLRIHRPELIEAVDGQQLYPPLNEAEQERIPMLTTIFNGA